MKTHPTATQALLKQKGLANIQKQANTLKSDLTALGYVETSTNTALLAFMFNMFLLELNEEIERVSQFASLA